MGKQTKIAMTINTVKLLALRKNSKMVQWRATWSKSDLIWAQMLSKTIEAISYCLDDTWF